MSALDASSVTLNGGLQVVGLRGGLFDRVACPRQKGKSSD